MSSSSSIDVIRRLRSQPVSVGKAEESTQAEIDIRRDGTLAKHHSIDALLRYASFLRQALLGDSHRNKKLLHQKLSWGYGSKLTIASLQLSGNRQARHLCHLRTRCLREMIFSGIEDELTVRNLVHQAVILIDAARPHAGQLTTQGSGLPDAVKRIALDVSNELVEPFRRLLIMPLPLNINVLRIVRPDLTRHRSPPAHTRKPLLLLRRRGRAQKWSCCELACRLHFTPI